jgi:uncharacterized membrane protein
MSFAPFYVQMTTLARQEVAELFFVLLILLLVSKEMKPTIQSALFMVFGLSLVVSHYGLFFIAVFFLFALWLVLSVAPAVGANLSARSLQTRIGIHKDKRVITPSPRAPERRLVTIVSISVLFIASAAWYFYTAQGTITQQIVTLGSHIAGSVGELFSPTYSQAVTVAKKGPLAGILHGLNAYVNYLNLFFVLAGVCLTVFLKQRFKLQFSYVVLSTIALGFLIASVGVPYLGAALDWTRVYQITLFVLAPFLAIGFITIGETAGLTLRKAARKLGFSNSVRVSRSRMTRLLAIYLVLFLLLSTGFLFALTEGYQNYALNSQQDGDYSHQTIAGATWQASNSGTIPLSGKGVTIYHYFNAVRYNDAHKLTNSDGQITLNQTLSSVGTYHYYATFPGDAAYDSVTSTVLNVSVGGNHGSQATSQATTSVASAAQTITLSASTTNPAVGQPVTFTATLTGRQVVYADYYNSFILGTLGVGKQAQLYPQNNLSGGANTFLGTYNIEYNKGLIVNFVGVNAQVSYANVTPLISNRSLIYSNGGASVYS